MTPTFQGQETGVNIAMRVIADESVAFIPLQFEEGLMGDDPRDPQDAQLAEAASNCHNLVRKYMLGDNIPEKVRIAYAIRLLANKRMPTPVSPLGKLDAKKNDRYLKDGLALAARLTEIAEAE